MRHVVRRGGRGGVTLLELIVVIAMLGLLLAVAAPSFIVPRSQSTRDLGAVLASAKRAAVLRGEPVTLIVDDGGVWTITGDANPTSAAIATGTIEPPPGRARIRVSPLGACIPEVVTGGLREWNAIGCGASSREVPTS